MNGPARVVMNLVQPHHHFNVQLVPLVDGGEVRSTEIAVLNIRAKGFGDIERLFDVPSRRGEIVEAHRDSREAEEPPGFGHSIPSGSAELDRLVEVLESDS